MAYEHPDVVVVAARLLARPGARARAQLLAR